MAATKFCGPKAFATFFHVEILLRLFCALFPVTGDLLKTCGDDYTGDGGRFKMELEASTSRVTEQPYLGLTLLTSNEERPRKGIFLSGQKQKLTCELIRFVTWNVRTLLGRTITERPARRTALIALKLGRYQIDIAALSETRLPDEGSPVEMEAGYTFF
ncbi:hypothetical protein HELRODRAFT_165428 [Helobdella robusta]|uniref:Uncharacterized protein n=1 Tax=Helobdella robusta TaxID=6412 RepID=T1EWS0_HELRO|nr:hypothetical protein HELRODRAFT_165428 [Helobdella robusta]ESN91398.1 hypothetical protein HELRODRAFT_165428 [Helobdella robusta]